MPRHRWLKSQTTSARSTWLLRVDHACNNLDISIKQLVALRAVIGPGDGAEPVLTVVWRDED
jgi:hypothetical protein